MEEERMGKEKEMKRGTVKQHLGNRTLQHGLENADSLSVSFPRGTPLTYFQQPGMPAGHLWPHSPLPSLPQVQQTCPERELQASHRS